MVCADKTPPSVNPVPPVGVAEEPKVSPGGVDWGAEPSPKEAGAGVPKVKPPPGTVLFAGVPKPKEFAAP